MHFDFDEYIPRYGTDSLKYDQARAINPLLSENAIQLWVADMDFACPPAVLQAIAQRLGRRILGYSTIHSPAYTGAVKEWMKRRYDWDISGDDICFSSGIVAALYTAVEHLTSPSDAVLTTTPVYGPFGGAIRRYGRRPLYSKLLNRDGFFTIDFDDFEEKARRKDCTLCLFCSPHNPTGRVWTEEELLRVGRICLENDVFLICDEIHADLIRTDKTHIPIARLFPGEKRIITCTSPSKTFNIAGNSLSNLIIPDASIKDEWDNNEYCGMPSPLAIAAAQAAYTQCDDWLEQLKAYLDESFVMMESYLKAHLPKALFRIPEGTYLGWVDLRGLPYSPEEMRERTSRAGVFVEFGDQFVENGDRFMRVNIATPRSLLMEGLKRICLSLQ